MTLSVSQLETALKNIETIILSLRYDGLKVTRAAIRNAYKRDVLKEQLNRPLGNTQVDALITYYFKYRKD